MGLYPKNLNEFVAGMGIPRGPLSKAFLVDPVNGDDDNTGTTWQAPLKSLEAAYALTTANRHDTVMFLAGATADNPVAAIDWSNSYTHLIGVGSEMYGVGQRCRVVSTAAVAATPVITFSGNGCIIKNMQFNSEKASGAAAGVALVTGERNFFEKVFFMCPTSVTAASYLLKISDGGENVFKDCTIGQHTLVRSAATHGLWMIKGAAGANPTRNKFIHCEFLSWSSTTGHALVTIASDINVEAFTVQFEDCLFANIISGAGTLAHAIVDGATDVKHYTILRGNNMFLGCGNNVVDPVTYTFSNNAAPAALTGAVAVGH
jgi:hypothetical protein